MTKTLRDRLGFVKAELQVVEVMLAWPQFGAKSRDEFLKLAGFWRSVDGLSEIGQARAEAFQFLGALEDRVDEEDRVEFGVTRIAFQHARLLGALSYLTTLWSLADQITSFAGRVLCAPSSGRNDAQPPTLTDAFVVMSTKNTDTDKNEKRQKTKVVAGLLADSIPEQFGYSIKVAYAMRNCFVHNGAQRFFESSMSSRAFRISEEGWRAIKEKSGLGSGDVPQQWESPPCDDLRKILAICERDIDDALGILLGSACGLFRAHVEFMLGAR